MLLRMALLLLGMTLSARGVAATPTPPLSQICRQSIPVMRETWAGGAYDASPAVATMMVDVIDGKLPQVRQQLQQMKPADARLWRQSAMVAAAWSGQHAVVEGLLDDGANVDGKGWLPPWKPAFFEQVVDGLKDDFRIGTAGVKTLKATGTLSNQGSSDTMALAGAVYCGDMATLDVLLRHHVNVAQREAPNVVDALTQATGDGNAAMVRRLLDHGADPCADDRHMAAFHPKHPDRPTHTLAQIGSRAKLSAALVARLICPAVATTQ
jgi:hypothetical protein